MDWFLPGYWWAVTDPPANRDDSRIVPDCTAGDPILIHDYYSLVVADLRCERCGAGLRRRVVIKPSRSRGSCAVIVSTRCLGWRRHLHRATVTGEHRNDVQLGELHRSRDAVPLWRGPGR